MTRVLSEGCEFERKKFFPSPRRLRVVNLSAGYGNRPVLFDVGLEFSGGQTLALLGPGGSGKSTLMRILMGDEVDGLWSRGEVEPEAAAFVRMSQVLPQSGGSLGERLAPALGGGEPEPTLRARWRVAPSAADYLLARWDMDFDGLPAGARRLAALTTTFPLSGSPLVLLDEPAADQEPELEHWTIAKLEEQRHRLSMILVTHKLHLARRLADRVALMVEGRIVELAGSDEFFANPRQSRTRDFLRFGS